MRSMNMPWPWRMQRRHPVVELVNSKSHFSTYWSGISKIYFYQNLKLVPLSNLRKFRLLTLTTAHRRVPGICTPNGHFSVHLGLTRILNLGLGFMTKLLSVGPNLNICRILKSSSFNSTKNSCFERKSELTTKCFQ